MDKQAAAACGQRSAGCPGAAEAGGCKAVRWTGDFPNRQEGIRLHENGQLG